MDSEKAEQFEECGSVPMVRQVFDTNGNSSPTNIICFVARCKDCGALVLYEDREHHLEWHEALDACLQDNYL